MIGPPMSPPNWFRLKSGLLVWNGVGRFMNLLRKSSKASPWKRFVPFLVATEIRPPIERPYSAGYCGDVDLELLYTTLRKVLARLAHLGEYIGNTIHNKTIGVVARPAGNLHVVVKGAGCILTSSGNEKCEVQVLSRVDRQLVDLVLGDYAADCVRLSIDLGRESIHHHTLTRAADRQRDILRKVPVELEAELCHGLRREARSRDRDLIVTRWNRLKAITAVLGGRVHGYARIGVLERNLSTGYDRTGWVEHSAGDVAE